ncbi:MAG: imelysin family protein [Myxococcales bacterium]
MKLSRRDLLLVVGLFPVVGGGAAALFQACAVEPDKPDTVRQEVLRETVSVVMLKVLDDLQAQTSVLVAAVTALEATPSLDTLGAAQAAFRTARGTWHQSQAFYIGPSQDISVTGETIDSWPAANDRIEMLVTGSGAVDLDAVTKVGANMRGFPGIEYSLFDSAQGNDAVLARLTEETLGVRRLALLHSQAQDLADKCGKLRAAWGSPDAGYAHDLGEAGLGNGAFERQRDGIDEILTGMLYLAELMVMNKFAKPLGIDSNGAIHPEFEEAPRSDGTNAALHDNLVGLKAIYTCQYGQGSGHSLSEAVRASNPDADTRFLAALDAAIAAVDTIPPPFRTTLVGDVTPIQNAYQKTRDVKSTLVMEVAGALGASIGFGYSDSD